MKKNMKFIMITALMLLLSANAIFADIAEGTTNALLDVLAVDSKTIEVKFESDVTVADLTADKFAVKVKFGGQLVSIDSVTYKEANDYKTVKIALGEHTQAATLYDVVFNGIEDPAKNSKTFVGMGAPVEEATNKVEAAIAVNSRVVRVYFANDLTEADLDINKFEVKVKFGGQVLAVQKVGYSDSGEKNVAEILLGDNLQGAMLYEVVFSGITDASKNNAMFPGVDTAYVANSVDAAIAVNSRVVRVYFANDLTEADLDINKFEVKVKFGGQVLAVQKVGYSDSGEKNVVEILLAENLAGGMLYEVVFNGITDASQNNAMFPGVDIAYVANTLEAAVAVSSRTVDVFFRNALSLEELSKEKFVITKESGEPVAEIANAVFREDGDLKVVRLNLDVDLEMAYVYRILYKGIEDESINQCLFASPFEKPNRINAAIATDSRTVEVYFEKEVEASVIAPENFKVKVKFGSKEYPVASVSYKENADQKVVLVNLVEDVNAGVLYEVIFNGIEDVNLNRKVFVGTDVKHIEPNKVTGAVAVDFKTVEVTFENDVDAEALLAANFDVKAKYGNTAALSIASVSFKEGSATEATIVLSDTLKVATLYEVSCTFILDEADNRKTFVGTDYDPSVPVILSAEHVGSNVVSVDFNIVEDAFLDPSNYYVTTDGDLNVHYVQSLSVEGTKVELVLDGNLAPMMVYNLNTKAGLLKASQKQFATKAFDNASYGKCVSAEGNVVTFEMHDENGPYASYRITDGNGKIVEIETVSVESDEFGGTSLSIALSQDLSKGEAYYLNETLRFTADGKLPSLFSKVEQIKSNKIKVDIKEYSNISNASLTPEDFTVSLAFGSSEAIEIIGIKGNKKKVFIELSGNLASGKLYKIEFNGATDQLFNSRELFAGQGL